VRSRLVEMLHVAAGMRICKLTAVHFQEIACCRQRAADAGKVRTGG